ncbi:MAG: homoserine O-acetyltransferase [Halioglobus sp.]|jgi:homoserine O-acetyltransferase
MGPEITEIDNGTLEYVSSEDFVFEGGGAINPLILAFECYGSLNEQKDNAIVVHHALSTSSHLTSTPKNPEKGWWQEMVGPGRHLDTDKYFVICINNLASCYGSVGPNSFKPGSEEKYLSDFPTVTIVDMVKSQKKLIDALGITQLHAIVGNSMGAMLSLAWLTLYPDHARHLVSISSSAQAYPANNANRFLQRDIIQLDPAWNKGRYGDSSKLPGFKTARTLGLLTYRNWAELNDRFVNKTGKESIEHYLSYNAKKFVRRFDCNSYLYLLDAMNTFNLSNPEHSLVEVFKPIKAKTLVVSVNSDILFTPSQQQTLFAALDEAGVPASYIDHQSTYGHDAFLIETEVFGQYISRFIGGNAA